MAKVTDTDPGLGLGRDMVATAVDEAVGMGEGDAVAVCSFQNLSNLGRLNGRSLNGQGVRFLQTATTMHCTLTRLEVVEVG